MSDGLGWWQKTEADGKQAIGKASERHVEGTDLVLTTAHLGENRGKMTGDASKLL